MQYALLQTKLNQPPTPHDILPRPRLLAALDEGRHQILTLISAPPGYGKSTLASKWAGSHHTPCAWVSLDRDDNDPVVFFRYVVAALQPFLKKACLHDEISLETLPPPPVPILSRQIINVFSRIATPFTLILDDYHLIKEPFIHDFLADLLAFPPQRLRLILLTRHDPPLPLALLRGRGQLIEIRADALRFTSDEVKAFVQGQLSTPLEGAATTLLEKKTEGWATGLRLASLYLKGKNDLGEKIQALSGNSLFIAEYLTAEVLASLDPQIADFLLDAAPLERFCIPLCETLQRTRSKETASDLPVQEFIRSLDATHLFIISLDDQGMWFRFHHLFQGFLIDISRKQRTAAERTALHSAAGEWFAQQGLLDEALQQFLMAGDGNAAVRLILAHRYEEFNGSSFHQLSHWLAKLPHKLLDTEPLLVTTRAFLALQCGQAKDFFALTGLARGVLEGMDKNRSVETTLWAEIAALESVAAAVKGEPQATLSQGQEALDGLPLEAVFMRAMVSAAMAVGYQMQGNAEQAYAKIDAALEMPGISAKSRPRILLYSCIMQFMNANSQGVLQSGTIALMLMDNDAPNHTRGVVHYFMGATHYLRDALTEAKSHLRCVLKESAVTNPVYVAHASGLLAFIALAEGMPDEAERVLEEGIENDWIVQEPLSPVIRNAFRVEVALRLGRCEEALRWSMGIDFNVMPLIWYHYVAQLTPIKLQLMHETRENLDEVQRQLEKLDKQMAAINRQNIRLNILTLLALVYQQQQEEAKALQTLEIALNLAEPGGWMRHFADLGDSMVPLLQRYVQMYPKNRHACKVLAVCMTRPHDNILSASGGNTMQPQSTTLTSTITPREREILTLLAEGLSNKEIAAHHCIAQVTVKTHLQNIYRKLKARGRVEAIKKARALQILHFF